MLSAPPEMATTMPADASGTQAKAWRTRRTSRAAAGMHAFPDLLQSFTRDYCTPCARRPSDVGACRSRSCLPQALTFFRLFTGPGRSGAGSPFPATVPHALGHLLDYRPGHDEFHDGASVAGLRYL